MQKQRLFGCSVSVFMVSKPLTNHFGDTRPSFLVSGSDFDSVSSMDNTPGRLFSYAAGLTNISALCVLQQTGRVVGISPNARLLYAQHVRGPCSEQVSGVHQ